MAQTTVVGCCMVRKMMAFGKDSIHSCLGHFMNSLKMPETPQSAITLQGSVALLLDPTLLGLSP